MSYRLISSMVLLFLIFTVIPAASANESLDGYLIYYWPRTENGGFIAYSMNGDISSDWDIVDLPVEPMKVSCFSIVEKFEGDCNLTDLSNELGEDYVFPRNAFTYDNLNGLDVDEDYPYVVLGWSGNPDDILILEPKRNVDTYAVLAEDYFRDVEGKEGLTVSAENVTQIWRLDLNGDGIEEVIYGAESENLTFTMDEIHGGYTVYPAYHCEEEGFSALFLRFINDAGSVTAIPFDLLAYDLSDMKEMPYYGEGGGWLPTVFTLAGVVDMDSDGMYEIITQWRYYEGTGYIVWRFDGDSIEQIAQWGYGL